MTKADDVLTEVRKQYGAQVATTGAVTVHRPRLPTGVFAFDLATGGGFPMGKASILYGMESSGKSSLSQKAIATMQALHPGLRCVLVDMEVSYDPLWGAALGIDNDALIRVLPDYAEQAVDIVEAFLAAEDVGLVVVDSLAAMIPATESEASAEKALMGTTGLVMGKLCRKIMVSLSRAERDGRHPCVILINQIRHKVGVLYGTPEIMPGGFAPKFVSSLTVRLQGKDEVDKEAHPTIAAWKLVSGSIQKRKVPIAAKNFEFRMATIDLEGKYQLKAGQSHDWPTLQSYLKSTGMLVKQGKHWLLLGEEFNTLAALQEKLAMTPDYRRAVEQAVISTVTCSMAGALTPEPVSEVVLELQGDGSGE